MLLTISNDHEAMASGLAGVPPCWITGCPFALPTTPFTGHSLPRLTGETKESVRFCMAIIKPLLWPQCINFICINGGYANIPHCEVLSYYFPCFLVLPTFPLKFSLLHLCLPLRFLPASPLNHFVTLDILPSCLNIIYI